MPHYRKPFKANKYYHIYNRGYKQNRLFYLEQDYKRFMRNIGKYEILYEKDIEIKNFCILPNHFHMLIKNKTEGLILSEFLRRLQISYAMYFKKKYKALNGFDNKNPIFEGRYNAKFITNNKYLKEVTSYIINNPVKHGYVKNSNERRRKL